MARSDSVFLGVGGGEFGEAHDVLEEFLRLLKGNSEARITVMTVATKKPEKAVDKLDTLFRGRGIKHVESIDVSDREDAFSPESIKKLEHSDALFFTGGDQLNITTLIGGSPLHKAIESRVSDGIVLAGTSAGAAMISKWMIISGDSDKPPRVGSVETAPGMDLTNGIIVDTHFSQRGRHGRLLTAIAHFPQALGIGIDERTAILLKGNEFRVIGEGVVTVIDGSAMKMNDLPYRKEGETIGLAGAVINVLPSGYKFRTNTREVIRPAKRQIVGA